MKCTKCGKDVKDSLMFCPVCGNELSANRGKETDYFIKCPVCGKEYLYTMNHCIECGYTTKSYKAQFLKLGHDLENYHSTQKNIPKCPTCQSTNIKKISATSKATNAMLVGLFGNKRKKQFHCNNCGYEW